VRTVTLPNLTVVQVVHVFVGFVQMIVDRFKRLLMMINLSQFMAIHGN